MLENAEVTSTIGEVTWFWVVVVVVVLTVVFVSAGELVEKPVESKYGVMS